MMTTPRRRPATVVAIDAHTSSLPPEPTPANTVLRKITQSTNAVGGKVTPCQYLLDDHVELLVRGFANGRSARNLAKQYGVRVLDIEARLRSVFNRKRAA